MAPSHIAILGGGITGLSSAFHLSRRFPDSLITLLEKESRLGGWIRSERVQIRGEQGSPATVVLEAGPRTLRPNAKSVLEMIHLLGLSKSIITTPQSSSAARNRFLHIPGTPGLIPLPSSFLSLLSSPLRSVLLPALYKGLFRGTNRPGNPTDESVDAFLTRRFGDEFARDFGSAVVHGIYAADSRRLSVRAAFPALWEAEERGWGGIVRGLVGPKKTTDKDGNSYILGDMVEKMEGVSIYSFHDGMSTLTEALERYLKGKTNISVLLGTGVTSLGLDDSNNFQLTTTSGTTITPTHIVSSLPLPTLHSLLPLPHLMVNPSSSVFVINLVFSTSPQFPIHPQGFGYLVPRPASDYGPSNPGILGTVFDSCTLPSQQTSPHLTKLTVMMGGPHPVTPEHTSLRTVLQHLASQLSSGPPGTSNVLPEPLLARVHHHRECIPTLMPGHLERMAELREVLGGRPWEGRLEVVGAGVGGVSVGDCVEAGRRVGKRW